MAAAHPPSSQRKGAAPGAPGRTAIAQLTVWVSFWKQWLRLTHLAPDNAEAHHQAAESPTATGHANYLSPEYAAGSIGEGGQRGTEVLVDSTPLGTQFLSTGRAVLASGRVPAVDTSHLSSGTPTSRDQGWGPPPPRSLQEESLPGRTRSQHAPSLPF